MDKSASQSLRGSRVDQHDYDYAIRAILLGDLGVGKTTFLKTYMRDACPSHLDRGSRRMSPTNGQKTVLYHGKKVCLTIWDTAGQEKYRSLTASYFRGAHACIVLYDVHNEESFENVTNWLDSVLDYKDTTALASTHTLLVGISKARKSPTNGNSSCHQRAENLASHYHIPHFQVDCENDPRSVDAVMNTVVSLVMTRAMESQQQSDSIRPYHTRLRQLSEKSRQSRCCPACCVI